MFFFVLPAKKSSFPFDSPIDFFQELKYNLIKPLTQVLTFMESSEKRKTVSLTDIARQSGFSVATVSKVLNNARGSNVSSEKRDHILKIASELNYRPNRTAKFLECGKTGQTAFIIPHEFFSNYAWRASASLTMQVYDGAVQELARNRYMTNLIFSPEDNVCDFLRRALLAERTVDGVLIDAGEEELSMAKEFEAMGIPVASFDWRSPRHHVSHVQEAPEEGIREAVEQLKHLGHRSAGCFYYYDDLRAHHTTLRTDIFIQSCRDAGIHVLSGFVSSYRDETDSYIQTLNLFSGKTEMPTILFYPSDHSAMMGMRALLNLGFSIPEEISIVGYDDAPYNINAPGPLATIRISREQMGREGAKLLMERILEPEIQNVRSVRIHTEFIPRTSVGPSGNKKKQQA